MVDFKKIIDRVKLKTGLNQKEIASQVFNISDKNLSNKIRRGSVDVLALIKWAGNENVDLHWLFDIAKPQAENNLTDLSSSKYREPETQQLLTMASKVLGTDSDLSLSLAVIIREFFAAAEGINQLPGIPKHMSSTQKSLEATQAEVRAIRTELDSIRQDKKPLKSSADKAPHHCCQKDRRQRQEPVKVERRTGPADRRRAVNE